MLDNLGNLKLKADDQNDLKVFAAYLQDSLIIPSDIKFLPNNKSLICIFNRFMWEDAERGFLRDNKRVRSALKFNDVLSVKSKNVDKKDKELVLEFLTIQISKNKIGNYIIGLIFSGNITISIETEVIDSTLEDFSDSWTTKLKPKHKI